MRSSNNDRMDIPFGGKLIVFGGDFRQILPVVPKGSRHDIVFATINSSYLWGSCKVLTLTRNMRLASVNSEIDAAIAKDFSEWILSVGDGKVGDVDDVEASIQIPPDLLITDVDDLVSSIVRSTYPTLSDIQNPAQFYQERAILAPTNEIVETVNDYVLSSLSGDEHEYLSADSICLSERSTAGDEILYSTEFLNSIKCSGVPNHLLKLKVGIPVMLLRNLDQSAGLCNGIRLIVTRLGIHIVQADIISGRNIGHTVYIPRIVLSPSDTRYPFKFQRRHFPVMNCFAMTINKSQGQTLSKVGLYLSKNVFSHG